MYLTSDKKKFKATFIFCSCFILLFLVFFMRGVVNRKKSNKEFSLMQGRWEEVTENDKKLNVHIDLNNILISYENTEEDYIYNMKVKSVRLVEDILKIVVSNTIISENIVEPMNLTLMVLSEGDRIFISFGDYAGIFKKMN